MLVAYEIMVIFKPLLPDDVRKGSHRSLLDLVKKHGGDVINADVWGKRYLAYPIASHEEGYYIVYEVNLPADKVKDVQTEVRRIPEILRSMITKIEHPEAIKTHLNKKVIDI